MPVILRLGGGQLTAERVRDQTNIRAARTAETRAIDILRVELDRVLALLGCHNISDLSPRHLVAINDVAAQAAASQRTREPRRALEPAE